MPLAVSPVGKAEILQGFPAAVPAMTGEPTLRELIRVLMHLMQCSLSLFTDLCQHNYLFLVLAPDIYKNETGQDPPAIPGNPGHRTSYENCTNSAAARAERKDEFEHNKVRHENCRHMNEALVERFLSLLLGSIRTQYLGAQFVKTPNAKFIEVYEWFVSKYAHSDEMDRADNRKRMLTDWHPNDGFETLVKQIQDGVLFAIYANKPFQDDEVVDMATQVAMKSGMFGECYKMWHRSDNQAEKTWANWQEHWRREYQLNFSMSKSASKFGFGMAAIEPAPHQEVQFEQAASDFASAHSATQSTISGLTQTSQGLAAANQQLAAQNQQLQMMLAAQQQQLQAAPQTMPFQWNQNNNGGRRNGRRNNNNSRRNNNQRNNSGWNPNQQNQGQRQQARWQQRPWPCLLATGQPINPLNIKTFNNDNYCWTHGHNIANNHTSATCRTPHPSGLHQYGATKRNMMGGNPDGENMHKPSECGLNQGTWKKERDQQGNNNWNPQPFANQGIQQPVQQQFMAPALTMTAL